MFGRRSRTSRRSRAIIVKRRYMQCSRNVLWIPTRLPRSFSLRVCCLFASLFFLVSSVFFIARLAICCFVFVLYGFLIIVDLICVWWIQLTGANFWGILRFHGVYKVFLRWEGIGLFLVLIRFNGFSVFLCTPLLFHD